MAANQWGHGRLAARTGQYLAWGKPGLRRKFCSLCQPPMSPLARGIQIIEVCNCCFWDEGHKRADSND